MMDMLTIVTGAVVTILVLLPFFIGSGGLLLPTAFFTKIEDLETQRLAIVDRYLTEEIAAERGDISKRAWLARQQFLLNRYVDASRRLDYLKAQGESK